MGTLPALPALQEVNLFIPGKTLDLPCGPLPSDWIAVGLCIVGKDTVPIPPRVVR